VENNLVATILSF